MRFELLCVASIFSMIHMGDDNMVASDEDESITACVTTHNAGAIQL